VLTLVAEGLAALPASYHEEVTNAPSTGEPEPQWRQPSFPSENKPKAAAVEGTVASGSVIVPAGTTPPPSVVETAIKTVAGVVWPVMILLVLMGAVSWWPAILIAIVSSTVLGNVGGHLKSRRKALSRGRRIPRGDGDRLR
jgi:hypothetical protein